MLDEGAAGRPGTVVISAIGGTAGVGKTALAVRWAHQVAHRFADGQLYVNLRGFDPPVPRRRPRRRSAGSWMPSGWRRNGSRGNMMPRRACTGACWPVSGC
jgi:hypothetical protein